VSVLFQLVPNAPFSTPSLRSQCVYVKKQLKKVLKHDCTRSLFLSVWKFSPGLFTFERREGRTIAARHHAQVVCKWIYILLFLTAASPRTVAPPRGRSPQAVRKGPRGPHADL